MLKKNQGLIFSFTFVLLLLIPMIFVDLRGGEVSERENRMLAVRPPVNYMLEQPGDFIRQFGDWFSDNVGFRDRFIDYYSIVKKLENNVMYTEGQYVMLAGEEGHHYFADANGWMIDKFRGKPVLSEEQLQGLSNGLNIAKSYLDKKGIPLITMLCTDKEEVYPEYYPKSIMRGPEPTQLDLVTDFIRSHSNVDVFNIKECLIEAKKNYLVYDKYGDAAGILAHYNEIGGFFAYQDLMKHIGAYYPSMEAITIDDVEITYSNRGEGGIYPNIPDVHLKQVATYRQMDASFFDGLTIEESTSPYTIAFENIDSSLPTILVMRDSYTGFGNYMSRYLPEHFGKTILIHWGNMVYFESYVERFNPDIVVFESAERMLGGSGFAGAVSTLQNMTIQ